MVRTANKAFKVLLVDQDQEAARITREKLVNAEIAVFQVSEADSLLSALNMLARTSFDVALIDLQLPDSRGLETLATIKRHAPEMPVVIEGAVRSDSLAPKAVEMGAHDYLLKSQVTSDALERVLTYAIARNRASSQAHDPERVKAAITGILGAKGGVGTTTLACHHAAHLASRAKQRVLLMDLDSSGSSASFLLEARSEYTVAEASLNLHRLDDGLWSNLVASNRHSVDVLISPGARSFDATLDGERVRHVLRFVRPKYDRIIVDLGRLNALSLTLVEEMNEIYVVTTADLPALYETGRVLRRLLEIGLRQEQVRLALNRIGAATEGINPKAVEQALGYPVYATIADHGAELTESHGRGERLAIRSQLHAQIGQFTDKVLGAAADPRPSGLRGLLRLARA